MARVCFDGPEDFMEEVQTGKEEGRLQPSIIRFTTIERAACEDHRVSRIVAIATAVVGSDIVQMEKYCGEVWTDEDKAQANARVSEIRASIHSWCDPLGIEVRDGLFKSP